MPMFSRTSARNVVLIAIIGMCGANCGAGLCSNQQNVFVAGPGVPGVSKIDLLGAQILITEKTCPTVQQLVASSHKTGDPCFIGTMSPGNIEIRAMTMVTSIVATSGHKIYLLPSEGLLNAWGGGNNENENTKARLFGGTCYDSDNCVFRAVFDEASKPCARAVQWEISSGKVSRTVFTCSHDVVDFFLSHIDPPSNVTVYN